MSKAGSLLKNLYNNEISEYVSSGKTVHVDTDNDGDIDNDDFIDCEGCDDGECDACNVLDTLTFDDEYDNYPTTLFPDLHYDTVDNYYSQELTNPNVLTLRSCQMCGQNEKMCGLRYCRRCYDHLRYKRRKILNAPFTTIRPVV